MLFDALDWRGLVQLFGLWFMAFMIIRWAILSALKPALDRVRGIEERLSSIDGSVGRLHDIARKLDNLDRR